MIVHAPIYARAAGKNAANSRGAAVKPCSVIRTLGGGGGGGGVGGIESARVLKGFPY